MTAETLSRNLFFLRVGFFNENRIRKGSTCLINHCHRNMSTYLLEMSGGEEENSFSFSCSLFFLTFCFCSETAPVVYSINAQQPTPIPPPAYTPGTNRTELFFFPFLFSSPPPIIINPPPPNKPHHTTHNITYLMISTSLKYRRRSSVYYCTASDVQSKWYCTTTTYGLSHGYSIGREWRKTRT